MYVSLPNTEVGFVVGFVVVVEGGLPNAEPPVPPPIKTRVSVQSNPGPLPVQRHSFTIHEHERWKRTKLVEN